MLQTVHLTFTRLLAMVDTAIQGRPFVAANVTRLRTIRWALLVIQLFDLAVRFLASWIDSVTGGPLGWSPSVTGWLCVLLVFVLARVFDTAALMQDDVEATV